MLFRLNARPQLAGSPARYIFLGLGTAHACVRRAKGLPLSPGLDLGGVGPCPNWTGTAARDAPALSEPVTTARVLLKRGGGVQGGEGGGLWGDPPPGDPELLEAERAPKKFFGLN